MTLPVLAFLNTGLWACATTSGEFIMTVWDGGEGYCGIQSTEPEYLAVPTFQLCPVEAVWPRRLVPPFCAPVSSSVRRKEITHKRVK